MGMPKHNDEKELSEKQRGDEIAETVQLASLAFDGGSLTDSELDDLCEAALVRDVARRKKKIEDKQA